MKSTKIEFPNSNGVKLAGKLEEPDGPRQGFALFAHCFTCSKDVAAASRISRGLAEKGIAILRFDFTGLGNSDGDFSNTNFSSNVEDLVAAANFLKENFESPKILVGHSLGGAAVLAAAPLLSELKAVVTLGAPSHTDHVAHLFEKDLAEIETKGSATVNLAGRKFQIKKQFVEDLKKNPLDERIPSLHVPLLILHSPVDETVSIDHARKLYEKAKHPKSFVSLDHADHLLTKRVDSQYAADVISAWVSKYIPSDAQKIERPKDLAAEGEVWVREVDQKFQQVIFAGKHEFIADEPEKLGGSNLGPNPYELLLAALGACTSMTIRMVARRKGWDLPPVAVRLSHGRVHAEDCEACETKEGQIEVLKRTLEIPSSTTEEQRKKILEIADKCPVHRTLLAKKEILTDLKGV